VIYNAAGVSVFIACPFLHTITIWAIQTAGEFIAVGGGTPRKSDARACGDREAPMEPDPCPFDDRDADLGRWSWAASQPVSVLRTDRVLMPCV
jgi:hypothetical protein